MAAQIWDPDTVLNINTYTNRDMFCVGVAVSRGNARCRWRITGEQRSKVCSILDEMSTQPPTEIFGSKLLSRLAKLSLCEEQHRYQHPDILERWDDIIGGVADQYEEMDELKNRNRQLKSKLAKERAEREKLRTLLTKESGDGGIKHLSPSPGGLTSQSTSSREASAMLASTQSLKEWEAREADLLLQVNKCERSLAESRGEAARLVVQEGVLARHLTEERCISAQRQRDQEMTAKQLAELQSQLVVHRLMSEELRRDLERATAHQKGLLAQTESLRVQSVAKSQTLDELRGNLDQAETMRAALLNDKEKLQSLSAIEFQTSRELERKVNSLEIELAGAQETIKRTQLDLTQSRTVNEEHAAAEAAFRATSMAETARLLDRIRQLEEQSRLSFLSAFAGSIKGLARHIALWTTSRRWLGRRNRKTADSRWA